MDRHHAERTLLARVCRVMAHRGLVEDVLGHVSQRVDGDAVLLRCRGPQERGLRFTTPDDIRLVGLDGEIREADGGYGPPNEAPLHLETLRRHAGVGSVLHAHPPAVVVASIAGIPFVPIFGSYDIPAARLAASGIPTYPRSVLIRRAELAHEMLASLGESTACVLAGHGVVTVGDDAVHSLLRALAVDRLARISLGVVQAGAQPTAIPATDLAELPDLGAGFNQDSLWRHHLAALAADGWDLDQ
jgi:ribulose-5-phosphate 4-epimerase/fuculose-1-phosphate aldolase